MNKIDIAMELTGNSYPGRGIIIGKSENGKNAATAYFIMGRSENSRNRIFVEEDGGLRTQAFDPAKLKDPSLVIYWPVRKFGAATIVTNGDQTDTIYEFLAAEKTFEEALRMRTFEPDPPILTPRISGLVHKDGSYRLSILKSANGNAESTQRFFYEYPQPVAGEGHFIHTYLGDGNPVPSFEGEPELVRIEGDIDSFTSLMWENLNEANKVSLFVRFIDLADGSEETRVVNKNN